MAVRSSAVAEDGANDAWAGQMDTFLDIDRVHLLNAVKKCWGSAGSARAQAYAKQKNLAAGKVAVVVEGDDSGDFSGVRLLCPPSDAKPKPYDH